MNDNKILLLGLGIESPWQLVEQHLETDKHPHELHLTVRAERGTRYACPECGALCPAHDFQDKSWRHLNFFQHHCYIHASVPRIKCPEHGVRLIDVSWARKASRAVLSEMFTFPSSSRRRGPSEFIFFSMTRILDARLRGHDETLRMSTENALMENLE